MTVREFLRMTEGDYDIEDLEYDAIVTCCYIDEINDNYDKFCDILTGKVELVRGGEYPVANWCGFVQKNLDKFKEFAREYWYDAYEDDEDELIYQWITEFHGYMAGMVGESFYDKLVEFFEGLEAQIYEYISRR